MAVTLVCDENRRLGEAANFSDGTFPVAFAEGNVRLFPVYLNSQRIRASFISNGSDDSEGSICKIVCNVPLALC